jgi:riboflavin synthase
MFTGIIESTAKVVKCSSSGLSVLTNLNDVRQGDSVSVNGVCLTVTRLVDTRNGLVVDFDYSPETKVRTNISDLNVGSKVNLECSLKVGDRFSGHIISGHVGGTGKLLKKKRQGISWIYVFSVHESLRKYIMPKGSVGVDGISLTVVDSEPGVFSASVIPYTLSHTNLGTRKVGERVNIEPDILAKYVEHLLGDTESKPITREFLRDHGFIR